MFDFKKISSVIEQKITEYHKLFQTPVSGLLWEEILYLALQECNVTAYYRSGSHSVSTDIISDVGKISCKSGKIRNNKVLLSGPRTSSHIKKTAKVNFLSETQSDFTFCLSREPKKKGYIFLAFKKDIFEVILDESKFLSPYPDISVTYNHSASGQFWWNVPIKYAVSKVKIDSKKKVIKNELQDNLFNDGLWSDKFASLGVETA